MNKGKGKDTFIIVVWGLAILALVYFVIKAKKGVSWMFGGDTPDDIQNEEQANLSLIETLKKQYPKMYTNIQPAEAKIVADELHKQMQGTFIDWANISRIINNNRGNMIPVFVQFGTRLDTKFANRQLNLIEYLVRAKEVGVTYGNWLNKSIYLNKIADNIRLTPVPYFSNIDNLRP